MVVGRALSFALMVLILVAGLVYILMQNGTTAPYLPSDAFYPEITIGGTPIKVEVVNQQAALERGLSGRDQLPPFHGMFFVFDRDDTWGIWMKDMRFPIDAVWIGADKQVIHIEQNLLPASYPRIYRPVYPARYVLEAPAGFVESFNIAVGDMAEF